MISVTTVDNSAKLIAAMREKLPSAVQAGAFLIENDAKVNCPVRTGTLRRSIHTDVETVDQDRVTARVSPGVDYGVYVELGTRRQHAHPYLTPAFESQKDNAVQEVTQALGALLR
jgi:HK97 gp10 family phage protein